MAEIDLFSAVSNCLHDKKLNEAGVSYPLEAALAVTKDLLDTKNPYVQDVLRALQMSERQTPAATVDIKVLDEFVEVLEKVKGTSAANDQLAQITQQLKKQLEQSQKTTSDLSLSTKLSEKQKNESLESGTKPTMGPKR